MGWTYRARLVCVVRIRKVHRDGVTGFLSLHCRQRRRRASDGGDAGVRQRAGYEGFGEFAEGNVYLSVLGEHKPGEDVRLERGPRAVQVYHFPLVNPCLIAISLRASVAFSCTSSLASFLLLRPFFLFARTGIDSSFYKLIDGRKRGILHSLA
jgi:hypothetical protein